MKPSSDIWDKLVAAARRAPADAILSGAVEAPHGFASRVVALAATRVPVSSAVIFERLAMRALACAVAIMLVSAAWNFTSSTANASSASRDERSLDLIDPVGEVLQIAQNS